MNLPALCIRRPVMTVLLMLALVVFGVVAYPKLPVNELPNVDFPTISVRASLPGASPETMATAVATPLENEFSTIAGVATMTSTSALGSTSITLTFGLDRNIDAAAQDVQAAISAAQRQLPTTMPTPPTFRKVNPADKAILYLTLSSDTLPLSTVNEYGETRLAQRLSMVDGVAQVNVFGSQKYAVRISVDPNKLAANGIGIDTLQRAIADANVNLATGSLNGSRQLLQVSSDGQLQRAAPYNDIVVAYRNGAPIRLSALGHASDGVQNDQVASWFDGKRAIVLAIDRQPGSNTVATVDRIRAVLPQFQASLPPSVKLGVLYDRSDSIRHSVNDVQYTLLLAGVLVILVIYLFLGNASATLIPALALPVSVIGTFGVMYALGYSLDNLSLLALTLVVGFVVDDAIVMLENIVRHVEQGMEPYEAALKGAAEIGFTIFSMTISLVAVFLPVMFMGGIVGRLFHEFAVTISTAILISGFVSITLTPMLCSRFIRHAEHTKKSLVVRWFDQGFNHVRDGYNRSLAWSMARPRVVLGVFAASLLATALLFVLVDKDFIPAGDTGQLIVNVEGPDDISIDAMKARQQELAAIVAADPNVDSFMSSVGSGGSRATTNNGTMFLRLKPASERALDPPQIIQELRRKFSHPRHPRLYPEPAGDPGRRPAIQGAVPVHLAGGRPGRAVRRLRPGGAGVRRVARLPGRHQRPRPQRPGDRGAGRSRPAGAAGPHHAPGASPLGAAFGANQVSTIYGSATQYWVILQVAYALQNDPAVLVAAVRHREHRRAGAAQRGGQFPAHGAPAHGQPPGPAARGDDLLQSRARGQPEPGGEPHRRRDGAAAPAGDDQRQRAGHRAGVPGFDAGHGPAAGAGGVRDLPGAWHLV
ncbi:Acriflavine resistance protein B OS=Rhodanobacter lindaniclasticus OX=75310 GN=B1991_11375 PE=4 SV=1 [Rhodanobacter lindaniclasticus]